MNTRSDRLEADHRVLAEQPFSILLGAELIALEPDRTELKLTVRREHVQQYGFVHGGTVSYLADNVLTYAGGSAVARQAAVTSQFAANDGEKWLCATAQGTIVPVGKSSE